ncbi:MAG: hypothetical protein K2P94_06425 [Rhodospirillaceae bacterium]|nr:hypothetical protein [Rhodospirillaceae bacterium]
MVGIISSIPITVTGSALLGTGGSAAASILGASEDGAGALFGNIGSTQNSLLQQIKTNASQRLADAQAAVNEQAADRNNTINAQNERWISVKAQINNAKIAVENGQESVAAVANTLLLMRGSIAGTGDPAQNKQLFIDQFNAQVTLINNEADSGGPAFNLVGNINRQDGTYNTLEYRNSITLDSTTLTGTYIGSDYRIEANDGTVWIPDLGSDFLQAYGNNGTTEQEYTTGAGQTITKGTSTRNGLKLLSYNPQTKAISMEVSVVPDDPPIIVNGTLKKNGIGVMQSWFYNEFATNADRQRAFADINAAEINLSSASGDLQRSATQTAIDDRHANAALSALSQQTIDVRNDQQKQNQDIQLKAAQQYLAMQANLQNMQSQQANYLAAFASFVGDDFTQSLLDINT